jgi:hypothetical protein
MKIKESLAKLEKNFEVLQANLIKESLIKLENNFNVLKESLEEISQGRADDAYDWMKAAREENYSFNNLFDSKMRILLPGKIRNSGKIDEETENDYSHLIEGVFGIVITINDDDLTVDVNKEYVIPKGPKKGKKVKKTETLTLYKLLKKVENDLNRIHKVSMSSKDVDEFEEKAKNIKLTYPSILEYFLRTEINNIDRTITKIEKRIENVQRLQEKVSKDTSSDKRIIISRHPIDVLRMSDFKALQSCHSEGGPYFHCAVDEAKGEGLVAYLVNDSKEIDNIDLQQEEIFADSNRNISGIQPISRVRLRKVSNEKYKNFQLAVPEKKMYGEQNQIFLNAVSSWAQEAQSKQIENLKNILDQEKQEQGNFVYSGGSYKDSYIEDLIEKAFNINIQHNIEYSSASQKKINQIKNIFKEIIENKIPSIKEQFDFLEIHNSPRLKIQFELGKEILKNTFIEKLHPNFMKDFVSYKRDFIPDEIEGSGIHFEFYQERFFCFEEININSSIDYIKSKAIEYIDFIKKINNDPSSTFLKIIYSSNKRLEILNKISFNNPNMIFSFFKDKIAFLFMFEIRDLSKEEQDYIIKNQDKFSAPLNLGNFDVGAGLNKKDETLFNITLFEKINLDDNLSFQEYSSLVNSIIKLKKNENEIYSSIEKNQIKPMLQQAKENANLMENWKKIISF